MKIIFLSNNSYGMYQFRKEVIEAALKKGKVYLCTPISDNLDCWKEIGCEHIPVDLDSHGSNPVKELQLIRFYKKLLKQIKPDIVFTYTIKPNIYGGIACAQAGIPYVENITGLGLALESKNLLMKNMTIQLYRIGLKKAKKVFFQNIDNQKFMISHNMVRGAYELLPGSGVNLEAFKLYPYPKDNIVNFAYIGRVMREKGVDEYLEAAVEIKKKHPEVRFNIFGYCGQDYKDRIRELQEKNVVIYHGLVNDMKEVYKNISCTIHPTFYPEGLSNVLLESAASGRPVITTNRPGSREVVDNGVNGLFVNERDPKDLCDKIEMFLSLCIEEREEMGIAGRRKVEKEFDRKIVVQKYMKEIDDIVD